MEPLASVIERTNNRVRVMDPVDHRTRMNHWVFDMITYEDAAARYALVPLAPDNGYVSMTAPVLLDKLSMRQLCERIKIPHKFAVRLEELKQAKLLGININTLMQHSGDSSVLFRTIKQGDTELRTARAILGSQFQPLDDHELLGAAEKHLEGAEVAYSAFGETGTHLTAVWPKLNDEGLMRGIHVANSEVGMRAITIEAVVYRPQCKNILPAVGLAHMGDGDQAYAQGRSYYTSKTKAYRGDAKYGWRMVHRGDTGRLNAFVRDAIEDAGRQYETAIARWRQGLQTLIPDPIQAIEDISKKGQLTVDQYRASLNAWAESRADFGPCVTGVANAFTLAAQSEDDPEQRYALQAAGTYALGRYRVPDAVL